MLLALVPLLLVAALPLAAPHLAAPPAEERCLPQCEVPGSALAGFVPPAAVVRSGAAVTWRGLDSVLHVNLEGLVNSDAARSCFHATYAGSGTATVVFHLLPEGIVAEQAGKAKPCTLAEPLPEGGAWLLPYQCVVHPLTMKGALVVVP